MANKRNVTPTKSNYSILKAELSLAKEGHSLLEQKREVFIVHLSNLVANIKEKRTLLDKQLQKIYRQLALVKLETYGFTFDLLVKNMPQDFVVDVIFRSIMGVPVPQLIIKDSVENQSKIPIGISSTSPAFDELFKGVTNIKKLLVEVAGLESAAWKLAHEVKKIQRRINALENFMIPDTSATLAYIKDTMEEKDRETLFQMKRIKERKKAVVMKGENHDY